MKPLFRIGALFILFSLGSAGHAADIQAEGAWSRATAPGQNAAMADVTLTSKQAATLVGFSTPAARNAELHSMSHEGGVMKMREVKEIALPAGKRVNLGEQGYHLMLLGLKAPLKAGESVPLTLTIRTADKRETRVEVKAEVKPLVAAKVAPDEHKHHHH
ncbi:MAG: copper chaperone PCu(A)C [Gallionella sp.]|nr:copper chaperone PCu(A)C [Gallionella sp.]